MQDKKIPLPIDSFREDILNKIQSFSTILIKASPGSGKTTRLPWAVARQSHKKVVVLEPRRLAAKLAAERIAYEENLRLGGEVGYHFRFDKNLSEETKLLFYTEGTFLKKLKTDPKLLDVGVVILDEFHERHLETDMALAHLRSLQTEREDLKIVLMSATLDENLVHIFKNPIIFSVEARLHPVDIHYLPNQPSLLNQSLELKIRNALDQIPSESDVLIFLPGMREILNIQSYLGEKYGKTSILHSEISKEEQEFALKPMAHRKIILATNIAESSITIPGIRAVIDSGIQREAVYSPWNGLKMIEDRPSTKASAIQRAGRAGRTNPGVAYRLYSKQDYESREDHQIPEIFKADLTEGYLISKQLNTHFLWPAPPPEERWQKAKNLSYLLGFTTEEEKLTDIIEKADHYPVEKKIARVLLEGEKTSREEKKKLLNFICDILEKDSSGKLKQRLHFYLKEEGQWSIPWEQCLLAGFIDQVAKYRTRQNDFIHFSGKVIKPHSSIKNLQDGFYLLLDITQKQEAILVIAIEEEWLFDHAPFPFKDEESVVIEPHFSLKLMTKLGSILIDEKVSPITLTNLNQTTKNKIIEIGKNVFAKRWLDWKETESFNRYLLWSKINGDKEMQDPQFWDYVEFNTELNWDGLESYFKTLTLYYELEEKLPFDIKLGGKKNLKIFYPYNQNPYLEAPIQDFYGLKETPKICDEKIVLSLRLIGPHKRPIQVTSDLAGFWSKTYREVIKELKRDYPRHHWPDDPNTAKPVLLKRQLDNN